MLDLQRHQNRKYKCNSRLKDEVSNSKDTDLCDMNQPNINANGGNHNPNGGNHNPGPETIHSSRVTKQCSKCLKMFVRMIDCVAHEAKCDGVHKLQCKICLKMFTTQQGKWKHTLYICFYDEYW